MRAAVIIPSGNGRHLLADCLAALERQTFRDFETYVVDNNSSDGTDTWIANAFPSVHLIPLLYNGLFARAVNEGIRRTTSDIVVLLNNDTEPEPGWLESLLRALDAAPSAGMAASKILLWDRRDYLHSAGDYFGLDGIPGSRGVWTRDDGRFDRDQFVFGACGGAAAYKRSMLSDIGLFDESLVAYCEDVDLNLRAQLAGYRCVFAPDARVYHRLSATGGGPLASYFVGRNTILVLAKNLPKSILHHHWAKMAAAQLRVTVESLRHILEPAARARLRGQCAAIRFMPRTLLRRRETTRRTRVPIDAFERLLARADRPVGDVVQ